MNIYKSQQFKTITYSIFITVLDQISKFLVLKFLGFKSSMTLIPKILKLTLVKNEGAAFSLFSNSTSMLTIISILASLIIIIIIFKFPPKSKFNSIGLAYLLGGTLGNGIDRAFKGYVLDFFELVPINFPIFNIADISINIAVIYFLLDIIKTTVKPKDLYKK
tara:strand:+ start:122 stop:610 length:489 start_codon:yes stop_codon:yes gene_type:complete